MRVASDNLPGAPVLRCGMEILRSELAGIIDVEVFDSTQLDQANTEIGRSRNPGPTLPNRDDVGAAAMYRAHGLTDIDLIGQVQAGELDGATFGTGQLQAVYGPIGIFSAVYVIQGHEHANLVWGSDVGDDLRAGLTEVGLVPQAFYWYGTRQMTSHDPIRTPADLAGVRLRVSPGSQVAIVNGVAMGANATTLPLGELHLALSSGLVDAQENPLPTIDEAKLYEVQDWLNLTSHESSPQFLVLSRTFVDSLTTDQKAALDGATDKAEAAVQECTLKAEAALLARWKAERTWKGGIVEDVDLAAFRAAAEPALLAEYAGVWGKLDLYERVRGLAGS